MFVAYTNFDEFLAACRAPVFVSNSIVYASGREAGQLKARSTVILTTVLEANPVEVIGVVSIPVEAPAFEARFVEPYKPHFINRNQKARDLIEEYVAVRRPDLRCCRGLLSNSGLTDALNKILPAEQRVFELVTSSRGRAVRPLGWKQERSRTADVSPSEGKHSSLLEQIIAHSMLVKGEA